MIQIRTLLESKGFDIWSVHPESTVYDALKMMAEKDIGALLVIEQGEVRGIFSERDYARKVILKGKNSQETPVNDIMTPAVIYLRIDQSVEECMEVMTTHHIGHLPILEENKLIGIISIGDVVKAVIADQEFMIDQLESYIRQER
ncbi:MAG: CBS domain-containing protein [Chloroflexi bacterium]|nr:CBS domain-containing protein [Chloroflexota bacterium]